MCAPLKWRLARMLPRELRRCTMSAGLILNPVTGVIIHCKALWVVSHTREALYKNQLLLLLNLETKLGKSTTVHYKKYRKTCKLNKAWLPMFIREFTTTHLHLAGSGVDADQLLEDFDWLTLLQRPLEDRDDVFIGAVDVLQVEVRHPHIQLLLLLSAIKKEQKITHLKPQDSFGEFNNFFSWSSESTPNHQKAPLNPPTIVLNDIF